MVREDFITTVIPEYNDIIQFWEDYNIVILECNDNSIYIDEDLNIEDNLHIILNSIEYYYCDKFLPELFDTFFNVEGKVKIDDLCELFYYISYIYAEIGNELVFNFSYFINTIEEFLKKSDIKYTINTDIDYNELINKLNSRHLYKCTYRV